MVIGEHNVTTEPDCFDRQCSKTAPPVQRIEVDDIIIHEKYTDETILDGYDIALIRLKTPASLFIVSSIAVYQCTLHT